MDAIALFTGIGVGAVSGFAVASLLARGKSAAASAALQAQLETTKSDLATARSEVTGLRTRDTELTAKESTARANAESLQTQLQALGASLEKERAAIRVEAEARAKLGADLAALHASLDERERSLKDVRATVDQSKQQLVDAFKATGGDVLKQQTILLLKQAKEQFDGHRQLSQQELEARQKAVEALVSPLKEQLAKQEKLVTELGLKREGDSRALSAQLAQIAELQQKASTAALTLSSAMRDNRQRGQWGEITLRNVVEMAGLGAHVDFIEQSSLEGEDSVRLRPDMIVRLPGGRAIPIDAKVPMNAYLDSIDTTQPDAERARKRESHVGAVRTHVRTLNSRDYAAAVDGEIELTVMFVPVESALVAALEMDGTLFKEALDKRVIITTPSTLLALLRTCAMQWQQAKLNENALKIGVHAKELLVRIQNVAEDLHKVGKGLKSATDAFNDAVGSYNRRLVPKARDTAELAGELEAAPKEIELQLRSARTDIAGGAPGQRLLPEA
ncbi:MAG: DNA recombination protein RmuC [Planctomycetes bacterium]|nr:DNA recombination protein RmuC [Planctomycetota bacterium]